MRYCTGCKKNLDLDRFSKKQSRCKGCQGAWNKKYYKENSDKRLEAQRKYRKKRRIRFLENKLKMLKGE